MSSGENKDGIFNGGHQLVAKPAKPVVGYMHWYSGFEAPSVSIGYTYKPSWFKRLLFKCLGITWKDVETYE